MTTYGSLFNSLMDNARMPEPEPGMGATDLLHSDRYAYTISRVSKSGKTFWMKRDEVKRVDTNGMSDAQEWAYTPQSDAPEVKVTLRKDGKWRRQGIKSGSVLVGARREYYDFSF